MVDIKRRLTDIEYIEEQSTVLKMQDEAISDLKRTIDKLIKENIEVKDENQRLQASADLAWNELENMAALYEQLKFRVGSGSLEKNVNSLLKRVNQVEVGLSNTQTKVHNVVKENTNLKSGIRRATNKLSQA